MEVTCLSGFQQIDFLNIRPQLLYSGRKDTKFVMHYDEWCKLIESIQDAYIVVFHSGLHLQTYSTLYYDTPHLKFYMAHHNGHGNRVKMRTRTYNDGNSFFEVKRKTNQGLTFKERYTEPNEYFDGLLPQLEVVYDRLTLYDKRFEEKITFDFNVCFRNEKTEIKYTSIVIAESKKMKFTNSVFVNEIKKSRLSSISFSKYCIGMASLNPDIKQNNFKILLQKIKKLNNKNELASNY